MCLLIWTFFSVSDVAHEPLVSNSVKFSIDFKFIYDWHNKRICQTDSATFAHVWQGFRLMLLKHRIENGIKWKIL